MNERDVQSVTGSGFEHLVAAVSWNAPESTSSLRVMQPGWLVRVDEQEKIASLIGFSVESPTAATVQPPADLLDVNRRLGRPEPGTLTDITPAPSNRLRERAEGLVRKVFTIIQTNLFNGDMTAKGLGSVVANTPEALQPRRIHESTIAVREIPMSLGRLATTYTRQESDSRLSGFWRIGRHGSLLVAATFIDKATRSFKGTELAMKVISHKYSDAPAVFMPAPPIWLEQMRRLGRGPETQSMTPRALLLRGGEYAAQNRMRTVGQYPVAALFDRS